MSEIFVDGQANTPECRCGSECEWPCWQRVGIAPPCKVCGCATGDVEATDAV